MEAKKGIVGSLFDYSFTSFLTPSILKLLYGLTQAGLILFCLFNIGSSFLVSPKIGMWMLLVNILILFFGLIYLRVFFEVAAVVFSISEKTQK